MLKKTSIGKMSRRTITTTK